MRQDEKMVSALLAHGANPNAPLRTWTPTRRSSHDFNFAPALVGATPFWLAARFSQPSVMATPGEARRRSAGCAPFRLRGGRRLSTSDRGNECCDGGDGNGRWSGLGQPAQGEREALMLEAVKLAAELGVDLNTANTMAEQRSPRRRLWVTTQL